MMMAASSKDMYSTQNPQRQSRAAPGQKADADIKKPDWVQLGGEGPASAVSGNSALGDEEQAFLYGKTPPLRTVPEKAPEAPRTSADEEAKLQEQEQSMRAEFATALARLRSGQRARAVKQIEGILNGPKVNAPIFRHMFTEFGINLRKSRLPEMALRAHLEARRLSPKDSHILFNAARVAYEMKNIRQTRAFLNEALELSPDLEPARRFLDFLDQRTAR